MLYRYPSAPLYLPPAKEPPRKPTKYLNRKEVCEKLKWGRTKLYNICDPKHKTFIHDFPAYFYPGNSNSRTWLEHEIDEWMATQAVKPLRRIKRRRN